MSYKLENILQSPEFKNHFDKFVTKKIVNTQSAIDSATLELTNLLVEGFS